MNSEKSLAKVHAGFIQKLAFTPMDDGKHFLTVSADKSIKIHNSDTYECVLDQQGVHTMGINDFSFGQIDGQWHVVTCSSDRTCKLFPFEENKLGEAKVLNLSEIDTNEYKDNVDKQQLAAVIAPAINSVLALSLNSDINSHNYLDGSIHTLRGHRNSVAIVMNFNNMLVSCDKDGRMLMWDPKTGDVSRPKDIYKHRIAIEAACCNS